MELSSKSCPDVSKLLPSPLLSLPVRLRLHLGFNLFLFSCLISSSGEKETGPGLSRTMDNDPDDVGSVFRGIQPLN